MFTLVRNFIISLIFQINDRAVVGAGSRFLVYKLTSFVFNGVFSGACVVALSTGCSKADPVLSSLDSKAVTFDFDGSSSKSLEFRSLTASPAVNVRCDARINSIEVSTDGKIWTKPSPNLAISQNQTCLNGQMQVSLILNAMGFVAGQSSTKSLWIRGRTDFGYSAQARVDLALNTAPATVIILLPAASLRVQGPAAVVSGTCSEVAQPVVLSISGVTPNVSTNCTSTHTFSAPATIPSLDGPFTIVASHQDVAQNPVGTASVSLIRDTIVSPFSLVSPVTGGLIGLSNKSNFGFSGTCEVGSKVHVVTAPATRTFVDVDCVGAAGNTTVGTSGTFSGTLDFSTYVDGTIDLIVSQTDVAANVASLTVHLNKDENLPVLTFTAPSAGVLLTSTLSNITMSGACESTSGTVTLSATGPSSFTSITGISCSSGSWLRSGVNLNAGFIDGDYTFTVSQTKANGNFGSASLVVTRDTVAPALAVSVPADHFVWAKTQIDSPIVVSGTCEASRTVTVKAGSVSGNTTCSAGGTFSYSGSFLGVADGAVTLTVTEKDAALNLASVSLSGTKDTVLPILTATLSTNFMNVTNTTPNLSYNVTETATVYVTLRRTQPSVLDVIATPTVTPSGVALTNASLTSDSVYEGTLYAVDTAGNKSSSVVVSWTVDTTPPGTGSIALGASPQDFTLSPSLTMTPNTSPIDGGSNPSGFDHWKADIYQVGSPDSLLKTANFTTSNFQVTGLTITNGPTYYAKVQAVDKAGNVGPATQSATWDYCVEQSFEISPTSSQPLTSESIPFSIPKACQSRGVIIEAIGEKGRESSSGGGYGATPRRGSGGIATGAYAGADLQGKTLTIKFGGAGAGGGTASYPNKGAGGRYAWVEGTNTGNATIRVVGGGGGGEGQANVFNSADIMDVPGAGGDSGLGLGRCDPITESTDRLWCGQNGNSQSLTIDTGEGGAAGITGGTCIAPTAGASGPAGGMGGSGKNSAFGNESGGGGGGWGGGGGGSGGTNTPSGPCGGRAGGGGGSVVQNAFASSTVAALGESAPHVRITIGVVDPTSACPPSYVYVPPVDGIVDNSIRIHRGFCVAKYESTVSGSTAMVLPNSPITTGTTYDNAAVFCANNNVVGRTNYKLIANAQWQTIAHDIHWQRSNWSSGYPSKGSLNVGVTANYQSGGATRTSALAAPVDSETNLCVGHQSIACDASTWNINRRTHNLSANTNAVVWDLGGNASEWILDAIPASSLNQVNKTIYDYSGWGDPVGVLFGPTTGYKSTTTSAIATANSNFGLGNGNLTGTTSAGHAMTRGGYYTVGPDLSGIFGINNSSATSLSDQTVGFRCVYEP